MQRFAKDMMDKCMELVGQSIAAEGTFQSMFDTVVDKNANAACLLALMLLLGRM